MNTSFASLTHKMQRAAVGKMVDVVLSHADKDPEKTMGQIVDLAKQFYGSSFSDETYERAKKTLSDPDSKWSKLINCVLDQTDPHTYIDKIPWEYFINQLYHRIIISNSPRFTNAVKPTMSLPH